MVSKRNDTGKWEIAFKGEDGKRKRLSHFKTKSEALIALAKIKEEIENGTYGKINKELTFKEASEKYIEQYAKIHCKEITVSGYEGYLKNHLLPVFGNKKMINITKPQIEEFIGTLKEKDLSRETINHIIFLQGAVFEKMIDDGVIKVNPVKRVKKLGAYTKKANYLTAEEIKNCLNTAKNKYPQYYSLLYTAIYTGLRQGELFVLTWDDISFEDRIIRVNKSYSHGRLSTTKTDLSVRNVRMCNSLANVLKQWQEEYLKNDNNLVFPNKNGGYLDSRNVLQRFFHKCLNDAGLKKIRWHDLRHTHISLLINQNVAPQVIQKQAGHSTIKTTMDVYGHLLPSVYNSSVDAIDNIFVNKEKPKLRLVK